MADDELEDGSPKKKGKLIRYSLTGTIELTEGLDLAGAMLKLSGLNAKAQDMGTATLKVSIPRLTGVKL